jgi:hypothetical protein
MKRKRLTVGVSLLVFLIVWTTLPWVDYSIAYNKGMEYSNKGTNLIASLIQRDPNDPEVMWLCYCAANNFSLASFEFERAAKRAKNNHFRVHLIESIYNKFPMKERARAEEMAGRSLRCSELALAISDEIKYVKEGKYTGGREIHKAPLQFPQLYALRSLRG